MMMDAEIYGITPSAKIDNRSSAPPENMLKMSRIVPCCSSKKRARATGSIPGAGMNVPMRYTISAPSKKNNRCRSSAKRVISPKADRDAAVAGLVATESLSFSDSLQSVERQGCLLLSSLGSFNRFDLAAGSFDCRLGTLGQMHALDGHRAADAARGHDASAQRKCRDDIGRLQRIQIND